MVKVISDGACAPLWPGRTKPDLHIMDYLQKAPAGGLSVEAVLNPERL